MESKRFTLNSIDWKKLGLGLLIALGGALATYLQETIPSVDFGAYTGIVVAINSVLVNAIRKYLTEIK
jgi:hypothetical protein